MRQQDGTSTAAPVRGRERVRDDRRALPRRFPGTDMSIGTMLLLVVIGLPRTVLADLGVVPPESGPLYYLLALTPFAVWLGVALARRTRRPLRDYLALGVLYGVSLVLVHQLLWDVSASLGHRPPTVAVGFADLVAPVWRDLALRAFTSGIALAIGVGCGLITAAVAAGARSWRSRRRPRTGSDGLRVPDPTGRR